MRGESRAIAFSVPYVIRALRDGGPSIEVRQHRNDGLEMGVWMVEPGQIEIVSRRVIEVLLTEH